MSFETSTVTAAVGGPVVYEARRSVSRGRVKRAAPLRQQILNQLHIIVSKRICISPFNGKEEIKSTVFTTQDFEMADDDAREASLLLRSF